MACARKFNWQLLKTLFEKAASTNVPAPAVIGEIVIREIVIPDRAFGPSMALGNKQQKTEWIEEWT